jgi:replicative DNA helicase
MTSGFQRSDLIIVAARPSMGKTAFCLNLAHNIAAGYQLPVAVFSLEMSKEQLVQRLLASEAGIESSYLRSGRIAQNQWENLSRAIDKLSETPIFIDDTANITVTQIRSQARRLQAEQNKDLGLVIIDYLQLMEGTGDNRVQELSRITRSLKGLARELSVPIIALSQLSRGVEARTNKRPMLSDLRESGCLTGDSLVTLADTGLQVPIKDLVGKYGFAIWALNENTMKLEKAIVTNAFSTGIKPVFTLKTRLGRKISATANHQFLTINGWKRLDELSSKQHICLPRHLPIVGKQTMTYSQVALLGHLIGDGCTLPSHAIHYTTREIDSPENVAFYGVRNPIAKWVKSLRVFGLRSYEKFVPQDLLSRVLKVANSVKSGELLALANTDIYWDEIISIKLDGEEEVFDLTVPHLHNFVANNIIVHNSIEQDADIVMMLYRDEYYSPDTPDRGIAEVHLAKHRNGPTGTIKLLFDPQFTKFKNLARPNNW